MSLDNKVVTPDDKIGEVPEEASNEKGIDEAIQSEKNGLEEEEEGVEAGKEVLRVQIQHLPKFLGMKQFKQFLRKMKITPKKAKIQDQHGFFQVSSQEELTLAVNALDGFKWKNTKLRARKLHQQPFTREQRVLKKAEETESEESGRLSPNSLEQSMLDAVIPLRAVPYEEQLQLKETNSKTLFESISKEIEVVSGKKRNEHGIFGTIEPIQGVGAEAIRNKCEFTIGTSVNGEPAVGFKAWGFRKGGTCPIVSAKNCPHISELMKNSIIWLEDFLGKPGSLKPFDQSTGQGHWRTMTVRDFKCSAMIILTLHPQKFSEEELSEVTGSIRNGSEGRFKEKKVSLFLQKLVNSSDAPVYQSIQGDLFAEEEMLGNLKFRISPAAFFQTCTKAAEILYTAVGKACGEETKSAVLLDICCGTGTIGISLAHRFQAVLGMELCAAAVQDARVNAEINKVENCKFVRGKAEEVFVHAKHYLPEKWSSVIGILDPPRNGLPDKLIVSIRKMEEMKTLIYVSCNPKAARKNFVDLCRLPSNKFTSPPFQIVKLIPVDMFPNTEHVEWIIVFKR